MKRPWTVSISWGCVGALFLTALIWAVLVLLILEVMR